MELNDLSSRIIGCAIEVHKALGPGLLESAYEECLAYELAASGLKIKRQVPMPLVYKNIKMEIGYRMDIQVEEKIIVEVKAVDALNDVHLAQVLTYLKLSGCKLGLLLNFNVAQMTKGIKRVIM
jgi:GxxExxY protein